MVLADVPVPAPFAVLFRVTKRSAVEEPVALPLADLDFVITRILVAEPAPLPEAVRETTTRV